MAKKKPTKKPAKKTYISKAPIRRLMKHEGAGLVAEDAVILLIATLTKKGEELTKKAVKFVKEDKRKRVTAADIVAANK